MIFRNQQNALGRFASFLYQCASRFNGIFDAFLGEIVEASREKVGVHGSNFVVSKPQVHRAVKRCLKCFPLLGEPGVDLCLLFKQSVSDVFLYSHVDQGVFLLFLPVYLVSTSRCKQLTNWAIIRAMNWWGKIFGGIFGFMLGGPFGLFFGIFIGHFFDRGFKPFKNTRGGFDPIKQAIARNVFFETTFLVMGHIAKADGRVTPQEIENAKTVMAQMGLNSTLRKRASALFTRGKQPNFDLDASLIKLMRTCQSYQNLLQMFVEIQIQAAHSSGNMDANEKRILEKICHRLGFRSMDFRQFHARYRAGRDYQRYRSQVNKPRQTLDAAYRILVLSSSATDAEVKKAYRRLMSQHHPDKLAAKGLPQEMMKVATQKTQEIKAAYDQIRKARSKK